MKSGLRQRIVMLGAMAMLVFVARGSMAQNQPAADPEDVGSIDAIIAALYDVISGPAGPRDWDRFRSLFYAGAQLIPSGKNPNTGAVGARRLSVDDYVAGAGQMFSEEPFFEVEDHRVTEVYGTIAHAFSTYASRRDPNAEPIVRGINSIQLMNDGSRWWIVNVFWGDERSAGPLPTKYTSN